MNDWIDMNDCLPEESGDWLEIMVEGKVIECQFKWWEAPYAGGNFVNILFEPEERHVTHWRKAELS